MMKYEENVGGDYDRRNNPSWSCCFVVSLAVPPYTSNEDVNILDDEIMSDW